VSGPQFARELQRLERELAACRTAVQQQELRRRVREERGMVFCRSYTVPAHYKRPPGSAKRK
jgi:hypothetical protein